MLLTVIAYSAFFSVFLVQMSVALPLFWEPPQPGFLGYHAPFSARIILPDLCLQHIEL